MYLLLQDAYRVCKSSKVSLTVDLLNFVYFATLSPGTFSGIRGYSGDCLSMRPVDDPFENLIRVVQKFDDYEKFIVEHIYDLSLPTTERQGLSGGKATKNVLNLVRPCSVLITTALQPDSEEQKHKKDDIASMGPMKY